MNFRAIIFLLFAAIILKPVISDGVFLVDIVEDGKVISYYDEYYVVQVEGTMTVYNGYNATMFEIMIPISLPYLALFETSNTEYYKRNHFYFLQFAPLETKSFTYEIRGVTPLNPTDNNMSVLRTAMFNKTPAVYSTILSRIQKAPIEEVAVNTSEIKSVLNRRLVTVTLQNPSNTKYYNISSVKVIKTSSENITQEMKRWTYPTDLPYIWLGPFEIWTEDIIDYNCSEGEVYWMSSEIDIDIESYVNGSHDVFRYDQEDLEIINRTLNESELGGNLTGFLEQLLFVKKSYSKTHFLVGDKVTVDIRMNNFAPISRQINVTDFIPYGFRIISDDNANISTNTSLFWMRNVNPDSSTRISYTLEYFDKETLGLDYFEPAIIKYNNETFYTQRTSFIRQFIPEKKVFVQKKLRSSINDEYVVTVKIQNLGESPLNNIHIKEFLDAGDLFREITVAPVSKGMWKIDELGKDEVWEVSYVTNDNLALTTLPAVLGVRNNVVLKTLIFEQTVRNEWVSSTVETIEKIGVGVLIVLPIVLIILNRRRRMHKENELRKTAGKIKKLKKESEPHPSLSINVLKRESNNGKEFPDSPDTRHEDYHSRDNKHGSEEDNKEFAHENIDKLKNVHDDTGHDGDNK